MSNRRLVTVLNEDTIVPRTNEVNSLRKKLRHRGVGPTRLAKALRKMLDYYEYDSRNKEADDFFDGDHTATLKQHIYGSIVVVEEYLRGKR